MQRIATGIESWWRTLHLHEEETAIGTLGRFELGIRRMAQEWWVWHSQRNEEAGPTGDWSVARSLEEPDAPTLERHLFRRTGEQVVIRPGLADRPVVARPIVDFSIPPGEEAVIFVSTPVWVEVEVSNPPVRLLSTPHDRPSDTWFGPSTREGELCYATRTRARLYLQHLTAGERRALTRVLIRNLSAAELRLNRFSLPVPYLSLFRLEDGALWTEEVTLDHKAGAMTELQIGKESKLGPVEKLAGPRLAGGGGTLVRAFTALFRPD